METESPGREVEIKLALAAEPLEPVLDQIRSLGSVGEFRFEPRLDRRMRDVYLDTPDRGLSGRAIALRTRSIGGQTRITLKEALKAEASGFRERLEIELPWSIAALGRVRNHLRERGVEIAQIPPDAADRSIRAVLASLGFMAIQDRTTARIARDVLGGPSARSNEPLGELVLDAVAFRAADRTVMHHEVEIEVAPDATPASLRPLVEGLIDLLGPVLRPWPHDKLATGIAIEELDARGTLSPHLDARNRLRPSAYDLIDAQIRA